MRVTIIRSGGRDRTGSSTNQAPTSTEVVCVLPDRDRATALEVLLRAQASVAPSLAFRYGCRNERCGLCAVEINGRPRLACRDYVHDGSRISALSTLPVLRDLVNDRSSVERALGSRLPVLRGDPSGEPGPSYRSLERCIQCFVCLDGCPLHAAGGINPEALLRIRRLSLDPAATGEDRAALRALAAESGLERCRTCRGCRCGIGIRLVAEVIDPLLAESLLAES